MKKTKGPWLVEETIQRYQGAWLEVYEDRIIRSNGKLGTFATARMKPGVSVLALDGDGHVYLTREFRYAIERDSVEVVSGAIEGDELALNAARRELREELGIKASEWIELGSVDPFTSIIHSPASLFLARELSFGEPACNDTEIIQMVKVKLSEAVRMVLESEITHGPSCILILKTDHFLNSEKTKI